MVTVARTAFRLMFFCTLLLIACLAKGQQDENLHIFGTIQPIFFIENWKADSPQFTAEQADFTRNTFALQQMDLFLSKQISNEIDIFVDLEFQLNYSTQKRWGDFSIQEAWLNYGVSNQFNIKAGLFFPAFNHLNELKNRLGILPYIFRPIPYERLLERVFSPEQFIPERAFVQLHGTFPNNFCLIEYALYVGNAEASYISRKSLSGEATNDVNPRAEFLSGVDPTGWKLKLYGARIGVRSRDEHSFKAGFSLTHDYDNLHDSIFSPSLQGDAPRFRFGLDVRGAYADFEAEMEYIHSIYDYDRFEQIGIRLENSFVSGMLGYNFMDNLFGYVSVQHGFTRHVTRVVFDTGYFGLIYHFNNSVSGKIQVISYRQKEAFTGNEPWAPGPYSVNLRIDFIMVGCSVLF